MISNPSPGIDRKTFQRLAGDYYRRERVRLCAARPEGSVVFSDKGPTPPLDDAWRQARAWAIAEALRWGDPSVSYAPDHHLIWAVPLLYNSELLGGLVATIREQRVFPKRLDRPAINVRRACTQLRRMAEDDNLTNAALLESRRIEYQQERQRAEAIHDLKLAPSYDLRRMYLRDEPDLIAAIRVGNRGEARAILNRILAAIHYHTGERFDLIKSFFMELVASVCRTAVEAGGDPEELLGTNFATIAELAHIDSLEQLAPWLHRTLERVIDAIHRHRFSTHAAVLAGAIQYLEQHFAENISRDDVARAVHVSPSHFSRLFRQHTGRTFTDVLIRMRVNQAAELLTRTDKPVGLIALECGFTDQSYFTKVFRRQIGTTPRRYRVEQAAS